MKFDRHTIWETQAVNTATMPLNTWFKMPAKQQREIFGSKLFGRKSIMLDITEQTFKISWKVDFGNDSEIHSLSMDQLTEMVKGAV